LRLVKELKTTSDSSGCRASLSVIGPQGTWSGSCSIDAVGGCGGGSSSPGAPAGVSSPVVGSGAAWVGGGSVVLPAGSREESGVLDNR